jgi:taurine transport system permease protein
MGERAPSAEFAKAWAVGVGSLVALTVLWQTAVAAGWLDVAFVSSPASIANAARRLAVRGELLQDILVSTGRVLIGFTLSAAVAIPLGLAIGRSRLLRAITDPVISIIRPLPSLAWIPLSMMWLGIDESQKYAIVFMGTFAPAVVFVADAARRVDPVLVRAARNLGAGPIAVMWEVVLPGALPSILAALKVNLAIAWACIISAEMVGATSGLGFLIWNAKDWANIHQVIVGMLAISALVAVLDAGHRLASRMLMPWQRSSHRPS